MPERCHYLWESASLITAIGVDVAVLAAQEDAPFEQGALTSGPGLGGALDASVPSFSWLSLRQVKENTAERSHWLTLLLTTGIAFLEAC